MNTFKKDDAVKVYGNKRYVAYIDGPFVYFKNGGGTAHYNECTLVPQPKFRPGDVVCNNQPFHRGTIRCVKADKTNLAYEYENGGWDYEWSLTLVKSADEIIVDLIEAGKKIEAIKQHRVTYGTGLKEAKDAVEKIRDILDKALATKPTFKVGDRVRHKKSAAANDGIITDIVWDNRARIEWSGYCTATDSFEDIEMYPSSPAIVARKVGSTYQPSMKPMIHETVEAANKEAQRLSIANPGVEFGTFVLAHKSTATAPVATTVAA